jgi:hypothetical protein
MALQPDDLRKSAHEIRVPQASVPFRTHDKIDIQEHINMSDDQELSQPNAAAERTPPPDERVPETLPSPPASRPADPDNAPPPMSIVGRGPMDQSTPDVPTGSTPVTRHDD